MRTQLRTFSMHICLSAHGYQSTSSRLIIFGAKGGSNSPASFRYLPDSSANKSKFPWITINSRDHRSFLVNRDPRSPYFFSREIHMFYHSIAYSASGVWLDEPWTSPPTCSPRGASTISLLFFERDSHVLSFDRVFCIWCLIRRAMDIVSDIFATWSISDVAGMLTTVGIVMGMVSAAEKKWRQHQAGVKLPPKVRLLIFWTRVYMWLSTQRKHQNENCDPSIWGQIYIFFMSGSDPKKTLLIALRLLEEHSKNLDTSCGYDCDVWVLSSVVELAIQKKTQILLPRKSNE